MWSEAAEAATAEVQECLYGVRGDNDELWHGVLDGCQDDATWSSAGENCEVYVDSEYCIDGGYGPGWHQDRGTFKYWTDGNGVDASTACCACGGGGISSQSESVTCRVPFTTGNPCLESISHTY